MAHIERIPYLLHHHKGTLCKKYLLYNSIKKSCIIYNLYVLFLILKMGIHKELILAYTELGYVENSEGICHGITLRWLEACLLNEEDIFFQRLANIISNDELALSISRMKKKKGLNLTQDDEELLDILAFFDSLHLFHRPENNIPLFQKHYNHKHTEAVSLIASSDKILESGGLIRMDLSINNYLPQGYMLTAFLNDLSQSIDALVLPPKKITALLLSGEDHTIGLTYSTADGWKYMNINRFPPKQFNRRETRALAEIILNSFIFKEDDSRADVSINVNIALITTKNDCYWPQLHDVFEREKIKNNSWFTEKTLLRNETTKMMCMAAYYGYHSVITEWAKYTVNLNQSVHSRGFTLAHIAAQQGHYLTISALATYHAELDRTDNCELTPAHWAAKDGHVSVLIELAKHSVDLNKPTKEGVTPAFLAAQYNQAETIERLIDLGADCTIPHITTVDKARESVLSTDDNAIIARMELFIEQKRPQRRRSFFDWPFFSCRSHVSHNPSIAVTPLEIAAIMGYEHIVNILSDPKSGYSLRTEHPSGLTLCHPL